MMREKNKRSVFIFALVFAGMALYLCPCAAAAPSSDMIISSAMPSDCCEEMPNCPMQGGTLGGIQSFLSSFDIVNPSIDVGLQYAYQIPGNTLYPFSCDAVASFTRTSLEDAHQTSPTSPKLFIEFASLLI